MFLGFVMIFFCFLLVLFGFGVFFNQPTLHNWGVSRGGSVAVAVGVIDKWKVIGDTQHVTLDT